MIKPISISSTEHQQALALMPYTGKVAKPTIYLFAFSLSLFILFSMLGMVGILPLWLVCIFNTICAYLLFTPLHEASHQNIRGRSNKLKSLETVIGWVSGFVLMAPFPTFRYLHNQHHKHTNHPKNDPDYWVASSHYLVLLAKCLTIYHAYLFDYVGKRKQLIQKEKTKREVTQSTIGIIFINALILLIGVFYGWNYILLIWVVPALVALAFLAFAFDWLPHHPHNVQQRYLNTRIMLNPTLSIVLVSQNMHLIHHLYLGIPFYHYAKAYRVLEGVLKKKGAYIE